MSQNEERYSGSTVVQALAVHPGGDWLFVGGPHGVHRIALGDDGRPEAPAEWTAGRRPYGVAVHPAGGYVYLTDADPGRRMLGWQPLDRSGRPPHGTGWQAVTLTRRPGALVAHPTRACLYIANEDESAPVCWLHLGTDGRPQDGESVLTWLGGPRHKSLAVHPHGTHLYVGDPQGRALGVLRLREDGGADGDGPLPLWKLSTPPGPLTVHPRARCVYFTEQGPGTVYRVPLAADGTFGQEAAPERMRDAAVRDCTGVVVHPKGTYLYASSDTTLTVIELDAVTGHPKRPPIPMPLPHRAH
ncbi:hypothetical protein AB0G73_37685 [Streptomyces sp. NPDC020719]|uniref:hypothetical protein n=1 Tax=unclassified Streptomyces TaxID=2593676 RepID=UPI0033FA61AE